MKKRKSKFLTFIFSLMPGAGHMYLGFMKMGISLISIFLFVIFISSWLSIGPLLFVLPLILFYSFFDCSNKCYCTDEEFSRLEDYYLFSIDKLVKIDKNILKKHKLMSGILIVFLGVYLIWNNLINTLFGYMNVHGEFYNVLNNVTRDVPKIIIGIVIIVIGGKIIIGKKKERDLND